MEGDVRLANGDVHFGRVEVFHAGKFGSVCDDFWTDSSAQVMLTNSSYDMKKGTWCHTTGQDFVNSYATLFCSSNA